MSLAAKDTTEEARKEAARLMGSIKTERKAAASRANGFKPGNRYAKNQGRKHKALSEFVCNCGAGDSLELWTAETGEGHKWDCMRGQAIKRRIKEGRDLLTGELLPSVAA